MYTELSHYLLMLAVFLAFNLKHRNLFWIVSLYFVMVTISFFTAIACYMCSDLSIYNLFTNSNANTPLFFKIAATWSNHEGSLLLWCWLLSVYGFWFCYLVKPWNHSLQSLENEVSYVRQLDPKSWLYSLCSDKKEAQKLQAQALFVYVYILLFFHAFLLTTSNPFLKIPFLCVNSVAELNPVLQDPILAIHPPCIYAGYVASAIGFSLCLSKCIQGVQEVGIQHIHSSNGIPLPSYPAVFGRLLHPSERVYTKTTHFWTELWTLIRVWILICWCFLTIGILLGSWWAYHELGWGGWWFWDPVENASLMPWLLATACIHSVLVPRLNAWTLFLNQFTFVLSILGTFFVRSGLLASVHSFATDSTRGLFILCFLVAILAISAFYLGVYSSDKRGTKLYAQRFWSGPRSHSSSAGKLLLQKQQYLGGPCPGQPYRPVAPGPKESRGRPYSAHSSRLLEHLPPEARIRDHVGAQRDRRFEESREAKARRLAEREVAPASLFVVSATPTASPRSGTKGALCEPKGRRRLAEGAKGFSTSHCKSGGTIAEALLLYLCKNKPLKADFFMRRMRSRLRTSCVDPAKVRIKALKHFVPADESSYSFFGAAIRDGGCFCMSIAESITGAPVAGARLLNEPNFVVAQRSNRIVTRIEQLLQMQNGCFLLICVVVLCGTAAPIIFQALLERDVSTGAPFFNGTIVPIFTCVLLLLLYVQFLVYSAVGKRTKRLQQKGFALRKYTGAAPAAHPPSLASHSVRSTAKLRSTSGVGFTGEEIGRTRAAGPTAPEGRSLHLLLHQTISLWLNQRCDEGTGFLHSRKRGEASEGELYCVLILMVLHWFLFKHLAGLSCLESAYAVICFVLFCTVILVLSIEISTQTRHEAANVASRLVAFSAQCYKNTITPVGLNMQTAHAGIVLFLIGVLVSNRNQTQWTQIMRSGYAVRLGHHICCLRGIDHNYGPTFRSICGNLVVYQQARIDPATTTHPIVVANLRQPSFGQARRNFLGPQVSTTLEGAQLVRSGYAADYGRCDIIGAEGWLRHLFGSDSFFCSAAFFRPLLTLPLPLLSPAVLTHPQGRPKALRVVRSTAKGSTLEGAQRELRSVATPPTQFHHAFGMFPEKRFFFSNQELSTTKVAIHTNLFSDIYALIGAGSAETGWFVTIMQLPFIGCIWVGFLLASIGGVNSLLTLFSLKRKLNWL